MRPFDTKESFLCISLHNALLCLGVMQAHIRPATFALQRDKLIIRWRRKSIRPLTQVSP